MVAAAKWFKDSAEKDYPAAKTALGNAYYYARGLDQDLDKALRWYRRAADDKDPTAMHYLGVIYEHGASTLGIDKDEAEALKWYARSSDASLALAKDQTDDAIGWNLSYFAEQSRKSIERIERNRKLLEVAANDLSEIDLVEIQKRADNGDAAAMFELVSRYKSARGGVEKDDAKSLEWLQKSADKDFPSALTNLGLRYFNGDGVEKDETRSFSYMKKAADLGEPRAIGNLGYFYDIGAGGISKDRQMALELYEKAANLAEPLAMAALGDCYRDGLIAAIE